MWSNLHFPIIILPFVLPRLFLKAWRFELLISDPIHGSRVRFLSRQLLDFILRIEELSNILPALMVPTP